MAMFVPSLYIRNIVVVRCCYFFPFQLTIIVVVVVVVVIEVTMNTECFHFLLYALLFLGCNCGVIEKRVAAVFNEISLSFQPNFDCEVHYLPLIFLNKLHNFTLL